MAKYWITEPCAYVVDNRVTVIRNVPVVADLDVDVVKQLGRKVRPVEPKVKVKEDNGDKQTPPPVGD